MGSLFYNGLSILFNAGNKQQIKYNHNDTIYYVVFVPFFMLQYNTNFPAQPCSLLNLNMEWLKKWNQTVLSSISFDSPVVQSGKRGKDRTWELGFLYNVEPASWFIKHFRHSDWLFRKEKTNMFLKETADSFF